MNGVVYVALVVVTFAVTGGVYLLLLFSPDLVRRWRRRTSWK